MSEPNTPIRAFRIKANKTQRQVAFAIGVTEAAYVRWEFGQSIPSGPNLIRILDYFRKELNRPNLQASELL